MKTLLQLFAFIIISVASSAQIITPIIKANFGIDADLRANYFNTAAVAGNDDWYHNGNVGAGIGVIDTSGASSIYNGYLSNPASRNKVLIRRMSYPPFSVVNNTLLMDAAFIRDFHGDDSTILVSGSKNGMSSADWTCPVSQSIPDKNEILEAYIHVKRDGTTIKDSLWMMGGLSIENTTGNRYFDFEMYQSDITYNRPTRTFTGYGPDAGHTSWQFDASGKIIKAGDIILTAEYGSSSLTLIEARIWINKNSLSFTPSAFNWGGQFDGAGSGAQYGYASIIPNTSGPFYTGLQSAAFTWGGPFGIVLGDNTVKTLYSARQFMEFSVNLTKLGLDPALLGASTCDRPFQKIMMKTRASTSFTAELKDFIAPFNFFDQPKVDVFTDVPIFCGSVTVSNIRVTNPLSTSIYNWSTIDGHFADTSVKTSVFVDAPGTYIVTQKLNTDCSPYSTDTVTIEFNTSCGILLNNNLAFSGKLFSDRVHLSWNALNDEPVDHYDIEKSTDGIHFTVGGKIDAPSTGTLNQTLRMIDNVQNTTSKFIYYRLKVLNKEGQHKYSSIVKIDLSNISLKPGVNIAPNPAKEAIRINIISEKPCEALITIYDGLGNLVRTTTTSAERGNNIISIPNLQKWSRGIYSVKVIVGTDVFVRRILLDK